MIVAWHGLLMLMLMVVIVMPAQPPRAQQIDRRVPPPRWQSPRRSGSPADPEPFDRLERHERGDAEQEQRAAVAAEHLHLPRAERVQPMARLTALRYEYAKAESPSASACELMCQPSASTAMELNHQPPEISTTIIAIVSHIARPHVGLGQRIAGVE
jgi:hypothetical protein